MAVLCKVKPKGTINFLDKPYKGKVFHSSNKAFRVRGPVSNRSWFRTEFNIKYRPAYVLKKDLNIINCSKVYY